MSSIFTRPRARPPLAAVSSQQVFREVHTEDELRAAVFSESSGTYVFGVTGRRIVIASPISVKKPIIVNASGTTIESNGKIPIFPGSDSLDCLFDISTGENITIRNLMFSNIAGFVDPTYCVRLGNVNSMKDCTVVTGNFGVFVGAYSFVCGNSFLSNGIVLYDAFSVISHNIVAGDITASTITTEKNVISMNVLLTPASIDTSIGGGGNTIVGNANVGTITNAATDAVTSNT